jgi:predicted type IV restriction endonuclease
MAISKRVEERMRAALKSMVPVLEAQKCRDVSEADTVTLVKDLLADCFGYDKYTELTSEHAIRGTFCDLAVNVDGKLRLLIEVKAIGLELTERHIKQAVDYAANQGVDWVVLTNSIRWMLFRVVFKKPIEHRLVAEFDITKVNAKDPAALEKAFLITREGLAKGALREFSDRKDAMSHYLVAAVILSDPVLDRIRRELRRVTEFLVDEAELVSVLKSVVIKREALEGDDAAAAARKVNSAAKKSIVAEKSGDESALGSAAAVEASAESNTQDSRS